MNERGICLVEVLVSFGLLGLGLALFLKTATLTVQLHDRSRRNGEALLLAQEMMETLVAYGWERAVRERNSGGDGGAPPGERRQFTGETVIRGAVYRLSVARKKLPPSLERYTVSCSWSKGSGEGLRKGRGAVLSTVRGAHR